MNKNTKNFIIIVTTFSLSLFILVAAPLCLYYLTHGNIHNHNLFIGTCVWGVFSLSLAAIATYVVACIYDIE
jgi:hypothetical protein